MPNAPHYVLDQDDGCFLNLVPGDTKISSKWTPAFYTNVLAQTVSYSAERHVRYGFIATDTVLVVLRIARQYT
ncbi:hypothetical protein G6O67_001708 [Ophiocordyceps sinensis]|uniref:Uncharacterized protein n=1 Tax=Ophiocordyceps sinensis TaxID=72228 RepID=A0A8H4PXZ4_9HYPO|nr:hypothetical protein G6O67_001708 [Ophiocordyceps sinensis]